MTWLLRISFSALVTLPAWASSVTGRVELKESRSPEVNKKRDYSGVVISLVPAGGAVIQRTAARHARMIQRDKMFLPHVLAIQTGTTVDFPNYDLIFHNAFSNYNGEIFDVGLYPPGTSRSVLFSREGVVRVFCNIHSTMSAVIVVLATPYFATTARDGSFEIRDVPQGEYTLRLFHERATPQKLASLQRAVAVGPEPLSLGTVAVSESGYLPLPHKDKYGHDYKAAEDDTRVYPGARK